MSTFECVVILGFVLLQDPDSRDREVRGNGGESNGEITLSGGTHEKQ